ncbi:MAG: hypothetical protein NUV59_04390 [Patescibacteria group bacterium]|nr:hypothetical protein [Patescibacteria group bacterium]
MDVNDKKEARFRPLLPYAVLIITALAWVGSISIAPERASSASDTPITGYGWSDTIGWISFNCSDAGTCGSVSYGMSVNPGGVISGYAWSEHIGWVSAKNSDLSGCPSSPCTARIVGGAMQGWLKALSGDSALSGGWDGWISLSGSGYGPSIISGGGFNSYAWGSDVVGWVDFSQVRTDFAPCNPSYSCVDLQHIQYTNPQCQTSSYATCTSPAFCTEGSAACLYPPPVFIQSGELTGHLQATPQIVPTGLPATLTWNVDNVSDCTVSGDNGDGWSGTSGSHSSSPILQQTIYTLSCDALDGSSVDEGVVVNVLPIFQEI